MPETTKKHLARVERERIQRNRIVLVSIITGVIIFGLLAFGVYDFNFRQPGLPIAIVHGEEILTSEFQARVGWLQRNLLSQLNSYLQLREFMESDPESLASLDEQGAQIQAQLQNPVLLGPDAINQLVDETLIRMEAKRRGIQVSEQELQVEIQRNFGFLPDGTPTPLPSRTPLPTRTPNLTATATVVPTSTQTPGPSPTPAPSQTPVPTPTVYTIEAFEQNYTAFIAELEAFKIEETEFKKLIEAQLYRTKLMAAFEGEIAKIQDHIHLRHILLEDETAAEEILTQLQEGAAWEEFASLSQDPVTIGLGGDLGWLTEAMILSRFGEDFVQVMVASEDELVGPFESFQGWHIVQVLGVEERELPESAFGQEAIDAFNQWLLDSRQSDQVEIIEGWQDRVPPPVRFG